MLIKLIKENLPLFWLLVISLFPPELDREYIGLVSIWHKSLASPQLSRNFYSEVNKETNELQKEKSPWGESQVIGSSSPFFWKSSLA